MSRARDIASHGYSSTNANILINPSFTVQQRGAVIDHAANGYGPDRWKARGTDYVGGTMAQSSTSLDATTGVNKLKIEHNGATDYSFIQQRIEAVNLQGLYGSEITFSFGYSDSGSGDPKVNLLSFDSGGTEKTLFDAVPTDLGGGRWSCTCTLSTDDGTFPDPSNRGFSVVIYPNEKNTAPDEWYVWEPKLEAGSEATPFVARPYGEELALCYRYLWRHTSETGNGTYYRYFNGAFTDTAAFTGVVTFPQTMRAIPTFSTAGSIAAWDGSGVFPGTVSKGGDGGNPDAALMVITGLVGNPTRFRAGSALSDNNNNSYLEFDAEL